MSQTHVPAWCERRSATQPDGRFLVACYYTRDGHPVSKARAERIEFTEYAPDGTLLRVREGVVEDGNNDHEQNHDDEIIFNASGFRFSH